jgi:hypothetical protein
MTNRRLSLTTDQIDLIRKLREEGRSWDYIARLIKVPIVQLLVLIKEKRAMIDS